MDVAALFSSMAAVIAPVFLVAALGFGWMRANLPYDSAFITAFAVNIATPCLVFSALTRAQIAGEQLGIMAAAAVPASRYRGWSPTRCFGRRDPGGYICRRSASPNAGNLGLPICLFAFGQEGLSLGVMFFATMAIGQFTIGPPSGR